jgi:hypothetical protein
MSATPETAATTDIAATVPVGTVAFEPSLGPSGTREGERFIWLEPAVMNKLRFPRGPGESYSDVILKVAAGERRS